jgi:magnesium-transporting ATPase (P-type)
MVCHPPGEGADVRNRGIVRGRIFFGFLLLFAAVIAWFVGLAMSPHGTPVAGGAEPVRTAVAAFVFKSAIGTLMLCALAGWLLLPLRRTPAPKRNWAVVGTLAVLAVSSVYQLIWIQTSVLN